MNFNYFFCGIQLGDVAVFFQKHTHLWPGNEITKWEKRFSLHPALEISPLKDRAIGPLAETVLRELYHFARRYKVSFPLKSTKVALQTTGWYFFSKNDKRGQLDDFGERFFARFPYGLIANYWLLYLTRKIRTQKFPFFVLFGVKISYAIRSKNSKFK